MAVWAAAAVGFGALLALAERDRGPLDDADPARQRPGLVHLGALPEPAPQLSAAVPARGRRTVVFFERPERLAALCEAIAGHRFARGAAVAVVVSGAAGGCAGAAEVLDPTGSLARPFGLSSPRDGGGPVGYVVVDASGRIRYRTLDPTVAHNLDEVDPIVAST